MKIATKTTVGFSILLAIMIAMTALGYWRLGDMASRVNNIIREEAKEERIMWDWYSETKANAVRAVVLSRSDDEALKTLLAPQLEATTKRISELQKQVEAMLSTGEAKAIFAEVGEKRKAYISARTAALSARKAGNVEESNTLVDTRMVPAIDGYVGTLNKMVDYQRRALENTGNAVIDSAASGRTIYVFTALLALALGLILMFWLRRAILRPLKEALQVAQIVASGDLTSKIEVKANANDEAGQLMRALDVMNHNLADIVHEARNTTGGIAMSSREMAASNLNLSSRTEQLAASIEETASSMEELTSTVRENAERAREAAALSSGASGIAQKGGQMVGDVVHTMTTISDSSKKISDIISVIDGIAFQTNILALNAAVEAARAGEQGRGFAVVAAEVRTLAQRSAQAAKEIKILISDSVGKVEGGARIVGDTGKTMQEVVSAVNRVNGIIVQIAQASQEQSEGIAQVNQAIIQMDNSTQQNAAQVEQAAATAQQMTDQAEVLAKVVARFKVIDRRSGPRDNGHAAARHTHTAPAQAKSATAAAPGLKAEPNAPRFSGVKQPRLTTPDTKDQDGEWKEF